MATHINLFNHEWCEMVFVNRNHGYGAFEIRQTNAKRHLVAIIVTLTLTTLIIAAPFFKKSKELTVINNERIFDMSDLPPTKDIVEKPKDIQKPKLEIQKNIRSMIDATIPKIVHDNEVKDNSLIPTNDSLANTDDIIGNKNIKGTPDGIINPEDVIPATSKPEIVDYVPQMPQFPGGEDALFKYLKKNLVYPPVPRDNGVQGTVYIQFVVFASGEIGNVEIARGFDVDCENEAMRVIKKMGNWLPGKQNGNAVNVRMSIPVKFKLSE